MTTAPTLLSLHAPVTTVPGIGRRTARLLVGAGIRTVAQFIALPDLLLEATFGPSLPRVRKTAERALVDNQKTVRAVRSSIVHVLNSFLL